MPFSFNAVELWVVTINEKLWTRAREVCSALRYNKKKLLTLSKIIVARKTTLRSIKWAVTPVDWPKDSQKLNIYISIEGMYELLFSSQQPKANEFRKHYCNVMFPHVRQQLTNKMKGDHQQAIGEKDAALALLNDDLQDCENQIQAITVEHVALQEQRDVY